MKWRHVYVVSMVYVEWLTSYVSIVRRIAFNSVVRCYADSRSHSGLIVQPGIYWIDFNSGQEKELNSYFNVAELQQNPLHVATYYWR